MANKFRLKQKKSSGFLHRSLKLLQVLLFRKFLLFIAKNTIIKKHELNCISLNFIMFCFLFLVKTVNSSNPNMKSIQTIKILQ